MGSRHRAHYANKRNRFALKALFRYELDAFPFFSLPERDRIIVHIVQFGLLVAFLQKVQFSIVIWISRKKMDV